MIGILNTWSDLNTCHMHFKILAEQIKRGVLQAGGLPMEVPVMSVGESYTKPTSMLYRNFLAMETEETLRSNPLDARGADGRLRQDDPRAADGRALDGHPGDLRPGRPDAARELARRDARQRLGRVEILGRETRRQALATRPGARSRTASRARPATA